MPEQPPKKRRQHHVWRHYLKSWATDDRAWVLHDGQIRHVNPANLAVERYFYKLSKLSAADIDLIRLLISAPVPDLIKNAEADFLNALFLPILFVDRNRDKLSNLDKIEEHLDSHMTNVVEDFHAKAEGAFGDILKRIKNKVLSFYEDPQLCIQFLHFIGLQYMRTKGIREKSIEVVQEKNNADLSRIWVPLSAIFAQRIAFSLFLDRRRKALTLIENRTRIPFITGDQPLINLDGTYPTPPNTLTIYYPITPELALLLPENDVPPPFTTESLTAADVAELNRRMATAAHRQVFALSENDLRPFVPAGRSPVGRRLQQFVVDRDGYPLHPGASALIWEIFINVIRSSS